MHNTVPSGSRTCVCVCVVYIMGILNHIKFTVEKFIYIGKDNHGHHIYFSQNVEFSFLETLVQDNWLFHSISLVTADSYKAHKKKPSLGFQTIYARMHNAPCNNLVTPANPSSLRSNYVREHFEQ